MTIRGKVLELRKGNALMRISVRHFVYAPDMAKYFTRYFAAILPELIDGVSVVDYSTPRVQTYLKSGLQFELASFPEEEGAIEGYFRWYTPQPGDLVFDMGAHCGVSTYHFSKLVGIRGRVIAFEPDPLNYSLLLKNIARHRLDNVTAVGVAIAGSKGSAAFNCEGTIGSGLSRRSSRATVGTVRIVDTITLTDSFETWGTPAFCKIDIEGAEVEALSRSVPLLRQSQTSFAIDTNHTVDGTFTSASVEKIFVASGYESVSAEVDGMLTTWARPASATPEHVS